MRGFLPFERFTRGLVSDATGVRGALLEADDVVPIRNGSAWRTRGGKRVTALSGSSPMLDSGRHAFSLLGVPGNPNLLLFGGLSSSVYQYVITDGTTNYPLPAQALDNSGSAISFVGATNRFAGLGIGTLHNDEMWVGSDLTNLPLRTYGHTGTATVPYTTGTVAGGAGTTTITGTGTTFTAGMVGCYIWINDATAGDRMFRIVGYTSATVISVDRVLPSTFSGKSFRITTCAWWSVKPGTFGHVSSTSTITSKSTMQGRVVTQHQGRVFAGNTVALGNRLRQDRLVWSATEDETDATVGGTGMWGGAEWFQANAYLDVFPGQGHYGGITGIQALVSYAGALYIFKGGAVFVLRGSVESDGRDVGASIDVVTWDDGIVSLWVEPVVTPEGVYWAGHKGLYLLSTRGLDVLTDAGGVRETYLGMFQANGGSTGTAGSVAALSVVGDRVIVHGSNSLSTADGAGTPNVLVYDRKQRVWYTQTTIATTRVYRPGGINNALGCATVAESGVGGDIVNWDDDYRFSAATAEDSRYPKMRLTSHAVALPGSVNSRIRGVQVRAKVVDPSSTNPELDVSVILGEQDSNTGVEAAISAGSVDETTVTEGWQRLPIRVGTPPVDSCRVRIVQDGASADCRLYEVGVEHVPVARTR